MTDTLSLPDKLPSAALPDLTRILDAAAGPRIRIDGRQVRTIGARSAELLVRFAEAAQARGDSIAVEASADLLDDLRLLGLHDRLAAMEVLA